MAMHKRQVLLVDDEPDVLLITAIILKKFNCNVMTATNGCSAVDLAIKNLPGVILLDLKLPDISGYEVIKRLKADQTTSHIPVILITAHVSNEVPERVMSLGACDYLFKPFEIKDLMKKVDKCCPPQTNG